MRVGTTNAHTSESTMAPVISPQYTLDVDGDVNTTGVYRVNGTQITTGDFE
ncbi:MAG: hypothetical protein U5K77_01005 [Candidatus Saccharibacteria bacterium]|nr:hypothetical protein [Candidatus Saccharibacteria bacterium]